MSPEFKQLYSACGSEGLNFNPEKSDIFSLGITYLRVILIIKEALINGLNEI